MMLYLLAAGVMAAGAEMVLNDSLIEMVLNDSLTGAKMVLNDSLIAEVNSAGAGWVAQRNPRFERMTKRDAAAMLGTRAGAIVENSDTAEDLGATTAQTPLQGPPPTDFDCRVQWPGCVQPIRDQGSCGACWAVAAAETLSDRFCIGSKGALNVTLAPQDLIACDVNKYNQGCDGGVPEYAWKYLQQTGISTENCIPYAANNTACPTTCADGTPMKKYKASQVINFYGVDAACQHLRESGPLQANFNVYEDFFHYSSGIYRHTTGALAGRHSVKIVGYGKDNGTDYWTVANSWGPKWGAQGYFFIARGSNECHIEDQFSFGYPNV